MAAAVILSVTPGVGAETTTTTQPDGSMVVTEDDEDEEDDDRHDDGTLIIGGDDDEFVIREGSESATRSTNDSYSTDEPPAPGTLTTADITSAGGVVHIDWSDAIALDEHDATAITAYSVYRSRLPDGNSSRYFVIRHESEGDTSTEIFDTDVVPGKTYSYRVYAHLNTGLYLYSQMLDVEAKPDALLYGYTKDSGEIQLFWSGYPTAARQMSLEVYSDADADWNSINSVNGRTGGSYTDTGVTADSLRHYRVKVDLFWGDSRYSNAITLEGGAPDISEVQNLTATLDHEAGTMTLTWDVGTTDLAHVAYHEIQRKRRGGPNTWSVMAGTRETAYVDRAVRRQTVYSYRVRAVGYDDESSDWVEKLDVGLVRVTCTDLLDQEQDVRAFFMSQDFGHFTITDFRNTVVYPHPGWVKIVPITKDSLCATHDIADFTAEYRYSYAHFADADKCESNEFYTESCDVYGLDVGQYSDWVDLPLRAASNSLALNGHRPQTMAGIAKIPNAPGLYRFDFRVCANSFPVKCSLTMTGDLWMYGTFSLPFRVPVGDTEEETTE